MEELYKINPEFRGYVDRYARKYIEGKSIPVEEALKHKTVQEVGRQYAEQNNSKQ